jgi:hypothetical protein
MQRRPVDTGDTGRSPGSRNIAYRLLMGSGAARLGCRSFDGTVRIGKRRARATQEQAMQEQARLVFKAVGAAGLTRR